VVSADFDRRFVRWLASDRDVDGSPLPQRKPRKTAPPTPIADIINDFCDAHDIEIEMPEPEAKTAAANSRWNTAERVQIARDVAAAGATTAEVGAALGTTTRNAWKFLKRHGIAAAPTPKGPRPRNTSAPAADSEHGIAHGGEVTSSTATPPPSPSPVTGLAVTSSEVSDSPSEIAEVAS
jgi:transposase-like protein